MRPSGRSSPPGSLHLGVALLCSRPLFRHRRQALPPEPAQRRGHPRHQRAGVERHQPADRIGELLLADVLGQRLVQCRRCRRPPLGGTGVGGPVLPADERQPEFRRVEIGEPIEEAVGVVRLRRTGQQAHDGEPSGAPGAAELAHLGGQVIRHTVAQLVEPLRTHLVCGLLVTVHLPRPGGDQQINHRRGDQVDGSRIRPPVISRILGASGVIAPFEIIEPPQSCQAVPINPALGSTGAVVANPGWQISGPG